VVRRIAPQVYAEMHERLVDATGVQFETRWDERLAEQGVTGNADAERVLGAHNRDEIAREIKGAVVHQVLGKFDLLYERFPKEDLVDRPSRSQSQGCQRFFRGWAACISH